MNPQAAQGLAQMVSLVVFATIAVWEKRDHSR